MKLHAGEILEWYDYPVLFFAADESKKEYICAFSKEREEAVSYVVAPLSFVDKSMLLNNMTDVRSVFLSHHTGLWQCELKDDTAECFFAEPLENADDSVLPNSGIYIGTGEVRQPYSAGSAVKLDLKCTADYYLKENRRYA